MTEPPYSKPYSAVCSIKMTTRATSPVLQDVHSNTLHTKYLCAYLFSHLSL